MVCQLLNRDDVTDHLLGNIDQLALLSNQLGAEQCTPRQPAVYAKDIGKMIERCVVLREERTGKGKIQGQRHTVSGSRIKALQIPTSVGLEIT